ncbi:helix-turn-helix domain-containing protein [Poriferisphaera sp. WC338]|uniref:helix-turn-helix domain-containing protein n=1 Tax=Poriferisphaera sp. WC338 TaxID=3425129 RepID=UPI003D81BBC3
MHDLVDTKCLCQRFGVTERTIRNWRNRKHNPLPYLRCGGKVRFSFRAVREWIESAQAQVTDEEIRMQQVLREIIEESV